MEKSIYEINDYIVYKTHGICLIEDIREESFGKDKAKTYYILSPVYDANSKIYAPFDQPDNENSMKHILSKDEIDTLIVSSDNYSDDWIDDAKERALNFENILSSGKRSKLLRLIKLLSLRRVEAMKNKKNLSVSDSRILATAEKIITEEFAFVLGIDKNDVIDYILSLLKIS